MNISNTLPGITNPFCCNRRQRIAEMKAAQERARYGDVREISKDEYVREVNKAGDGIWVIIHVYKPG